MRGSWRVRLAALLLVALVLRMALALATSGYVPSFDAADFVLHAETIGEAGAYPASFPGSDSASAFRPPAYPYLLAALWEVTGRSVTAARLLGAVLGLGWWRSPTWWPPRPGTGARRSGQGRSPCWLRRSC